MLVQSVKKKHIPYPTLQGPRTSLDELKALRELKQLKELKEHLGNICYILNIIKKNPKKHIIFLYLL